MKDALGLLIMIMDLLAKDGFISIHTRNLEVLATDMFKVNKNMSTEGMQRPFSVRQTHCNLRNPMILLSQV